MDLDGLGVIVTGAATGLGAATARLLAQRGARLALFDTNEGRLKEIADELTATAIVCDVSKEAKVSSSVELAVARLGSVRALINAAGIAPHPRLLPRDGGLHSGEEFDRTIAVNLAGTFHCCRFVAKHMSALEPLADGSRGVIVNTASIAAFESPVGGVAYAASKAGVVGMTLPMARELGDYGIRVMAIAPGPFETPMFSGFPAHQREGMTSQMSFPKQPGKPQWFAELVEHIIRNEFLNGETIRLDAGIRLPRTY